MCIRWQSFVRIVLLLVAGWTAAGCPRRAAVETVEWPVMGTFASLGVPASCASQCPDGEALVRQEFADIDATLSVWRTDTELARVNQAAGQAAVPVSPATFAIVEDALRYAEQSGGAFDPTVAPLVRLWGFLGDIPPARPAAGAIDAARALVDRHAVICASNTVYLAKAGMQLDLGGIAKGYAVDRACQRLEQAGARHALVNLGGNIRAMGYADGRQRPWRIGVRDPFDGTRSMGTLALAPGMAVATSGNYERFVEFDGHRYAHILDPRTGEPIEGMAGVTVVCPSATQADALSTALFVQGMAAAPALLARYPGTAAVLVPDRQPAAGYANPAFLAIFTPDPRFATAIHPLPAPAP